MTRPADRSGGLAAWAAGTPLAGTRLAGPLAGTPLAGAAQRRAPAPG